MRSQNYNCITETMLRAFSITRLRFSVYLTPLSKLYVACNGKMIMVSKGTEGSEWKKFTAIQNFHGCWVGDLPGSLLSRSPAEMTFRRRWYYNSSTPKVYVKCRTDRPTDRQQPTNCNNIIQVSELQHNYIICANDYSHNHIAKAKKKKTMTTEKWLPGIIPVNTPYIQGTTGCTIKHFRKMRSMWFINHGTEWCSISEYHEK